MVPHKVLICPVAKTAEQKCQIFRRRYVLMSPEAVGRHAGSDALLVCIAYVGNRPGIHIEKMCFRDSLPGVFRLAGKA